MTPLKPHWPRPSHPAVQQVVVGSDAAFASKSLSRVSLPPGARFAAMDFPPCTAVPEPSYASVQMARDGHLLLNSDLMYINHSCEPSLIFDTEKFVIRVGPHGLKPGDELTFFYPSTEWALAQPFACLCGAPTCQGTISGARDMSAAQLRGFWLNRHIRELLDERDGAADGAAKASVEAAGRRGPTSRELSGEMGGDTQ